MEHEIIKKADQILSGIIETKDVYEKVAMVLKFIPIESFEETFRFFSAEDQKNILDALEVKTTVCSIETTMVILEFIKKTGLSRYLKTVTNRSDELLDAFQKYAGKHPRKISQLLEETWLI